VGAAAVADGIETVVGIVGDHDAGDKVFVLDSLVSGWLFLRASIFLNHCH
jgi:hypothetical protein